MNGARSIALVCLALVGLLLAGGLADSAAAQGKPEGEMRWALYVTLSRLTYAIDAATCDLRWLHPITYQTTPLTGNSRGSA